MLGLFLLATNVDDLIEKAAEPFYINENIGQISFKNN